MCKFKPCNLCRPFLVSRGNLIKHKKDALGSISLSVSLSWWRVYTHTHTHYTQLHKFLMETTTTTARIRRKMNTFKINRLKSKLRTVRTHVWPGRAANRTESWKSNQSHRLSKRIRKCNQVWATWWMFIFFLLSFFFKTDLRMISQIAARAKKQFTMPWREFIRKWKGVVGNRNNSLKAKRSLKKKTPVHQIKASKGIANCAPTESTSAAKCFFIFFFFFLCCTVDSIFVVWLEGGHQSALRRQKGHCWCCAIISFILKKKKTFAVIVFFNLQETKKSVLKEKQRTKQ